MEECQFISIEDDPSGDLILSYAVGPLDDIVSIILLRTPQFENLLPEVERGIHVSDDSYPGDTNFLQEFIVENRIVKIEANEKSYEIDCSKVDEKEWKESLKFITKMNYDDRFKIRIV